MKIKITFAFLVLCFFSMLLSGCGKSAPSAASMETESPAAAVASSNVESTAEKAPVQSESTAANIPGRNEQYSILMSMYDKWNLEDEPGAWFYAFSDLDHNGRCEVIVSSMQGTGLYTYSHFYELNADFDGITECIFSISEGDSGADIIQESTKCFFDAESNTYYYLFGDTIRNGAAEHWYSDVALWLKDGEVHQHLIATRHEVFDNGSIITEYLQDGVEITEEAYQSAISGYFAGMDSMDILSLQWEESESSVSYEPMLVFAEDMYDGYGFLHQQCDKTAVYDFSPINSENTEWEVYLLDREFTDAERFIPQAYRCALKGSGSLEVFQGQWIYVYCPCNVWTSQAAPEGCAFSWGIDPDKSVIGSEINYRYLPDDKSADSIIITKNPRSETVRPGGNTWFIAHADNALYLTWIAIDTNGIHHSLEEACSLVPGLELEDIGDDTLAVRNIPIEFNDWGLAAVFTGSSDSVITDIAFIHIQ